MGRVLGILWGDVQFLGNAYGDLHGRFVKVLDRFIDNSQFIIVTHSKRTMARADVMYGVTMEEFGVSKPVGMRLTNADGGKADTPKSAAQKAALRLDA